MKELGDRFALGLGVRRDDALATTWYRKAAKRCNSGANLELAFRRFAGLGVERDDGAAFGFVSNAESNDPFATNLFVIGRDEGRYMFMDGPFLTIETKKRSFATIDRYLSFRETFDHYRLAAEDGRDYAAYLVGYCFAAGIGVEQDYAKAIQWFKRASELGSGIADEFLSVLYAQGLGTEQDADAAIRWLVYNNRGEVIAARRLGDRFAYGVDVDPNFELATRFYRRAAERGDVRSQRELARLCELGLGVEKDPERADFWRRYPWLDESRFRNDSEDDDESDE